ncbi:hypothetical protein BC830DRAFT_265177 [Chytriomyces sp. MP71]|nr:hypothetical protein BC830DRAFT_265177 [Chytriomyces sp. MP71]
MFAYSTIVQLEMFFFLSFLYFPATLAFLLFRAHFRVFHVKLAGRRLLFFCLFLHVVTTASLLYSFFPQIMLFARDGFIRVSLLSVHSAFFAPVVMLELFTVWWNEWELSLDLFIIKVGRDVLVFSCVSCFSCACLGNLRWGHTDKAGASLHFPVAMRRTVSVTPPLHHTLLRASSKCLHLTFSPKRGLFLRYPPCPYDCRGWFVHVSGLPLGATNQIYIVPRIQRPPKRQTVALY